MYEELEELLDAEPAASPQSPSLWDSATELPRVLLEMTALTYTWPALATAPRGDGHTVLVLPGFMAADPSTLVLRRYLGRLNYQPVGWTLGQNTGSPEQQEQLLMRFDQVIAAADGPVSLVGQSLGGVYARMLALRQPDKVRQVVTLGSPFASKGTETINSLVNRLFQYLSGLTPDEMRDQMVDLQDRLPMPATAIYSKADGVVHWTSCVDNVGGQAENVEVLGSHSGMGFNPLVLHVVADRLAQVMDQWRPFQRKQCFRSLMYPEPEPAPRLM